MPIVTENHLRDQIRQPHPGMTVTLPVGSRFTPAALDFIKQWKIEVVFAESEDRASSDDSRHHEMNTKPAWDNPGAFPVVLSGDLPHCITCGMPVHPKPEHMTQLDATHFSPKNTPRIRFRGKMDTLNALFLLVQARARTENIPHLAEHLNTLAAYCREITSAEYNNRDIEPLVLDGLNDDELRQVTHDPKKTIGIPHLIPGTDSLEILHWLNLVRCQVREAELTCLDAFLPLEGQSTRPDLVRAVNRLSNAVYYLELMFVAGKLSA